MFKVFLCLVKLCLNFIIWIEVQVEWLMFECVDDGVLICNGVVVNCVGIFVMVIVKCEVVLFVGVVNLF